MLISHSNRVMFICSYKVDLLAMLPCKMEPFSRVLSMSASLLPQALLQYTIASSATAKAASQADGQQQQQQQQDSAAALFQQLHTGEGFDAEQVGMLHMQTLVHTQSWHMYTW